LPLLDEVVVDFLPVTQIVADRRIDIGERERRVLLNDLFGGRAVVKGANDRLKRHACPSDAHDPIGVGGQRG